MNQLKKKRDGGGDGGVSALEEQQLGGGEQSPAPGIEKEQLEAAGGSLGLGCASPRCPFPGGKAGKQGFPWPPAGWEERRVLCRAKLDAGH